MDFLRVAALLATAWSVEAKIYLKEDFMDGGKLTVTRIMNGDVVIR